MALLFPTLQFLDPNYTTYARPLALGKIYTYEAGTTTPKATYTDSTEGTSHANPIILNSNGQPEVSSLPKGIWLSSDGLYKIVVKNAAGTTLQEIDNVTGLGSTLTFFSTLSANLDTNGYSLVTTSVNQDITIQPNGTGQTKIYGLQAQDSLDMNGYNIEMDNATAITDDSGNEYIKFAKTATAVNEITVTNQATGSNPQISATGGDTNIGLDFLTKGTGAFQLKGNASQAAALRFYEDTDNGTNYSAVKAAETLANNNGILTLPTVAVALPTALPSVSQPLYMTSAGAVEAATRNNGIYLGQLTSAGSYASTTILTGYTKFYIVIRESNLGITSSSTNTYLGIQLYISGAYATTGYATSYWGVAHSAGTTVVGKSAVTAAIVLADTTSGGNNAGLYSGTRLEADYVSGSLTFQGFVNNIQLAGVASLLNIGCAGGGYSSITSGTLTGLKLIAGTGGISGSNPIDVYGIV